MTTVRALTIGVALILGAAPLPAFAAEVAVNLTGLQAKSGKLYVALQKKDEFLLERGTAGQVIDTVEAGTRTITFNDIAPGDYSVSVWHDIDGDGKFSKAENGTPLDGWSILHAETLKDTPTWDQVKFSVPQTGKAVSLAMMYPR